MIYDPGPRTVGEYIERLKAFPADWPVKVATPAGGGIAIEHREVNGKPVIAVFGSNGGRFGENPLTEEEYQNRSREFLDGIADGLHYTNCHGDHRLYHAVGPLNDPCYDTHYDDRIIKRMVDEGLLEFFEARPFGRGVRVPFRSKVA